MTNRDSKDYYKIRKALVTKLNNRIRLLRTYHLEHFAMGGLSKNKKIGKYA